MILVLIRRAEEKDTEKIKDLLNQVLTVHSNGRPDLFEANSRKYTDPELLDILNNDNTPVFVAEDGAVLGYAFCVLIQHKNHNILTDIKTLYIDDLCVDQNCRRGGVGRAIYEYVIEYARSIGCYNVTLNVWACNESAMKFYQKCGLKPQKIGMEKILN